MRILLAIPFLLLAFPAWAQSDDTHQCLTDFTGTLNDIDGAQGKVEFNEFAATDKERWDARTATWTSDTWPSDVADEMIDMRNSDFEHCWAGGIVYSVNDYQLSWRESKGECPHCSTVSDEAFQLFDTYTYLDGVRIHNMHDALRPSITEGGERDTSAFYNIKNVWVTYNRDDCIENDFNAGMLVDDSLFDGCYVFYSNTRTNESLGNVVTIQNSLVYLQEMPGPNGWADNDELGDPTYEGHGELFKDSSDPTASSVILKDNVFFVEECTVTGSDVDCQLSSQGNFLSTPYTLDTANCSNNVIVWKAPASDPTMAYPGDIPDNENCIRVTTDIGYWLRAKYDWIQAHPLVERLPGAPTANFTFSCTNLDCTFTDTSSDPEVGTLTYRMDFGENSFFESFQTSHSFAAAGTYEVALEVRDEEELRDVIVKTVTVTSNDSALPTVSITSYSSGRIVDVDTSSTINVTASDDTGVVEVQFYVNGDQIAVDDTAPYSTSFTPTSTTRQYTIVARALDTANNKVEDRVTVWASASPVTNNDAGDVTDPTVSITSPDPTAILETNQAVSLTATASDGNGVYAVLFKVNGDAEALDTASPYTTSWTPTVAGTYTIQATAIDDAGNEASASLTVDVQDSPPTNTDPSDEVAPAVSITSPSGILVVDTEATLTASCTDANGVASVIFYWNGNEVAVDNAAPFTTPYTPTETGLQNIVAAVCYDLANNRSVDTTDVGVAAASVTNPDPSDSVNPTISITAPTTPPKVLEDETISVTASDADAGIWQIEIEVDGDVICTLTASGSCTHKWLSGQRFTTIRAKAKDKNNNLSVTSTRLRVRR